MAGTTITTEAGLLTRQYLDGLIELNDRSEGILKRFKKVKGYRATGSGLYFGTRMRDNQGFGARAESGTLPTAGYQTYIQGYEVAMYQYYPVTITGPAEARAQNGGGFLSDPLMDDIETGNESLRKDMNRQACRAGDGIMATTTNAGASATSMTVNSTRHISPGVTVEVYTTAGSVEIAAVVVSNVNPLTRTLTIADSSTWTLGSYVYRDAQYNAGTPLEIHGLKNLINNSTSATLHNINPSTYFEWTSHVDATGGAISRDKLFKGNDYAETFSGKVVNEFWMNRTTRNKLFMLVQPGINFDTPKDLEIAYNPGDNPLTFEGKVFCIDNDIFDGEIFGINWESLGKIVEKELGIRSAITGVGTTLIPATTTDTASGFLSIYQQNLILNRRACWRLESGTTDYQF